MSDNDLEKSGIISLTKEDLSLFGQGIVSDRLKSSWSLTLEELADIINNRDYNLVG